MYAKVAGVAHAIAKIQINVATAVVKRVARLLPPALKIID